LNQHTLGPQERFLVYVDRNRDLMLSSLNTAGAPPQNQNGVTAFPTYKLHPHVDSFIVNDETDVIVALADGLLNVWYQPSAAFVDKDLVGLTSTSVDASDYGRSAQLIAYTGNRIGVRKVDGSILFSSTPPDIPLFYDLTRSSRWDEAIRLCRHQNNPTLWGSLASIALAKKQLDTAEIALCELNEVAKVRNY
jgi:intraflagellar transport protein 80